MDVVCLPSGGISKVFLTSGKKFLIFLLFVSKPKWGNGKYNTHTLIYIPCFSNLSLIRVHSSLPQVVKPTKHYGSWLLVPTKNL